MKNIYEVHIVPVWNEYQRILSPIEHHRPDTVYLLEDVNTEPPSHQVTLRDEICRTGATVNTVSVDLFDMYDVMGSVTTLADDHADDLVRVNVTSGTKHASIGATMACMDEQTDAEPYFAKPTAPIVEEEMPQEEELLDAETLDIYPIDSPTRDQLAALAVVEAFNTNPRRTKLRHLIDEGVRMEFDCFVGSTEGKGRYQKLAHYIVEPLREKGYIDVDSESGRAKYVTVTDSGHQTLRAFRHRVEDVIEDLENRSDPMIDLELDDPTDSVKEWVSSPSV